MFKSLKPWMNLPFVFRPCIGRSGTGTKQFAANESGLCYAEGSVKVVKDAQGKEVVSTKQLYVDGNSSIKELDNVVFEGRESEIKAIGYFYRNGLVDMKVVYL
jgi:hypothetical protein